MEPETNQEKGNFEKTEPIQGAGKNFPRPTIMSIPRRRRSAATNQEQDTIKEKQENSNKMFWKLSIHHSSGV